MLIQANKIFLLITVLLLTGIVNAESRQPYIVAFAQDTLANDFRRAQVEDVRLALSALPDVRFEFSDANTRTSLLIYHIENFIRRQVDVLIIGTNDADAVVPVVNRAHAAGIPVIILDRGINGDKYTTLIHSQNALIGEIAGNYIAEKLNGKGTVLLFEGLPRADVTQLRTQGFLKVMQQHENIRVIKRIGNFLRRDTILEMEKLVKQGIDYDAIFAESDSMLSGVRLVMDQHGIDPGSIVSVGVDFIPEAKQAIRVGAQSASILFPLGGQQTATAVRKILAGEAVDRHIDIPVKLVTKDNVEQMQPVF